MYGDFDRVSSLTELINGTKTLVKGLGYDDFGRLNKETFPSGYYTENHYDDYGNLTEVTDRDSRSIWKATQANARGQLTKLNKGAKETVYGYDETKGQLTSMVANNVVNYGFEYDTKNNLEYRSDNLIGQKEKFTYDPQNRLTNWDILNSTTNAVLKPNSITYDGTTGNIIAKSDLNLPSVVTLNYEKPTNPHALTTITPNTNAISQDELAVTYTDFRKIKTLNENGKNYTITYGVDDQRRISEYTVTGYTKTRYYLGDYEEETDNAGNVKKFHYLSGGAMMIDNNGVETLYYGYTDNQGSLIALTDQNGNIVQKYAYDPWGARRDPSDWRNKDSRTSFINNRGYTGHEHLDNFGIINMNGRVYDPLTAMFFSPDPFIQSGGYWKNYNRYSYCMNNPTNYTDPSGYYYDHQNYSVECNVQSNFFDAVGGMGGGGSYDGFTSWEQIGGGSGYGGFTSWEQIEDVANDLLNSPNGGTTFGPGQTYYFKNNEEAELVGMIYIYRTDSWGNTIVTSPDYSEEYASLQVHAAPPLSKMDKFLNKLSKYLDLKDFFDNLKKAYQDGDTEAFLKVQLTLFKVDLPLLEPFIEFCKKSGGIDELNREGERNRRSDLGVPEPFVYKPDYDVFIKKPNGEYEQVK